MPGEDAKAAGSPVCQAKPSEATVSQPTLWAPAPRRQVAQWQMTACSGGWVIR
jgi:hypothetical protein